jgi:uncharacterized BrkB/YihY/UPF0761 family membrane protein
MVCPLTSNVTRKPIAGISGTIIGSIYVEAERDWVIALFKKVLPQDLLDLYLSKVKRHFHYPTPLLRSRGSGLLCWTYSPAYRRLSGSLLRVLP